MSSTELDTADLSRPHVAPRRLLIALAQGVLLYWLYRAGVDKQWPASVPMLYSPLLLVALFCPLLWIVSLGHLAPRRVLLWVGGAALLLAALGAYDGWRRIIPGGALEGPPLSPLLVMHLIAALFIAHTLVHAASVEGRRIAAYPVYFDTAWKLAVQLVFSAGFVGATWLVLNLGGALFKLIQLDFLESLLRHAWFNIPVITFAFACAIHITDVRPAIVRGIRGLILVLLAWLLPVVTLLVGGFVLSLPFTGLAPLWATRHAAAVLLGVAAMLVVMINTAWQNGAALPGMAAPVRWSARAAALLLAPLVAIAAWALQLRVADYGWTVDRIVACACIVVAACYALGYFAAALRSAHLDRLGAVNIATAFVVLAVILAVFSPVADPARIAVASQLARLAAGKVTAEKFDYAYLRFSGERYGREALARLQAQAAGPNAAVIRSGVAHALDVKNSYEAKRLPSLPVDGLRTNLTMWPAGASLPAGFLANRQSGPGAYPMPSCLAEPGQQCDVFAIDLTGTGKPDLLVLGRTISGGAAVFHEDGDGVWRIAETLPFQMAGCGWYRERLIAGQYRAVTPARKALEVGGTVLQGHQRPVEAVSCPGGAR